MINTTGDGSQVEKATRPPENRKPSAQKQRGCLSTASTQQSCVPEVPAEAGRGKNKGEKRQGCKKSTPSAHDGNTRGVHNSHSGSCAESPAGRSKINRKQTYTHKGQVAISSSQTRAGKQSSLRMFSRLASSKFDTQSVQVIVRATCKDVLPKLTSGVNSQAVCPKTTTLGQLKPRMRSPSEGPASLMVSERKQNRHNARSSWHNGKRANRAGRACALSRGALEPKDFLSMLGDWCKDRGEIIPIDKGLGLDTEEGLLDS
jgi:hypothetical protein